jgi:hypothetical protein
LQGALSPETIRERKKELIDQREFLQKNLDDDTHHLLSLPDVEVVRGQAEQICRELLLKYNGIDHLKEMTFDDKRMILHWRFGAWDNEGKDFSIYIEKGIKK